MKIVEIADSARKVIQQMNSLYISYSINDDMTSYNELMKIIENSVDSLDLDIEKQAKIYKNKLHEELISILRK